MGEFKRSDRPGVIAPPNLHYLAWDILDLGKGVKLSTAIIVTPM